MLHSRLHSMPRGKEKTKHYPGVPALYAWVRSSSLFLQSIHVSWTDGSAYHLLGQSCAVTFACWELLPILSSEVLNLWKQDIALFASHDFITFNGFLSLWLEKMDDGYEENKSLQIVTDPFIHLQTCALVVDLFCYHVPWSCAAFTWDIDRTRHILLVLEMTYRWLD